jgi:hypothetical protein
MGKALPIFLVRFGRPGWRVSFPAPKDVDPSELAVGHRACDNDRHWILVAVTHDDRPTATPEIVVQRLTHDYGMPLPYAAPRN